MFKSTSSDYRVDKRVPSECWISANNHYLDYPFHIPVISWIEKKTVTAMVEKTFVGDHMVKTQGNLFTKLLQDCCMVATWRWQNIPDVAAKNHHATFLPSCCNVPR